MPAPQVEADDKGYWIIAAIGRERRINAGRDTCAVTIAPVENLVLEKDYRLTQAVPPDVLDQRGELFALNERKDFCERMKRDRHCRPPSARAGQSVQSSAPVAAGAGA